MDSPINEEMIYCNLVAATFSFYEKYAKSKITEFFKKYDPRKSINRDYIVNYFDTLYTYFGHMLEDL